MNEQQSGKNKQREPFDLEQRLTAYYGPPLREQPLAAASWQNLRLRLASQDDARRRRSHFRWPHPLRRSRAVIPAPIEDALARITYEARIPCNPSMIRYRLAPRVREPVTRGSWLGRRKIRLVMPIGAIATMGQAELDVLLATGLARSMYARKPAYTLGRLLLAAIALVACIPLVLIWTRHLPPVSLLISLALCAGVAWAWHTQARALAFHADTLMVRWLGREHVCSGLHALADGSRAPGRRRWGEPSLVERIERVCGTRVGARDDQLTLVR